MDGVSVEAPARTAPKELSPREVGFVSNVRNRVMRFFDDANINLDLQKPTNETVVLTEADNGTKGAAQILNVLRGNERHVQADIRTENGAAQFVANTPLDEFSPFDKDSKYLLIGPDNSTRIEVVQNGENPNISITVNGAGAKLDELTAEQAAEIKKLFDISI